MVNFYSGFITTEGARVMKDMFEAGRELHKKYPVEHEYKEAWAQWHREHTVPRGRCTMSSIISSMSSRSRVSIMLVLDPITTASARRRSKARGFRPWNAGFGGTANKRGDFTYQDLRKKARNSSVYELGNRPARDAAAGPG